MYLEAEAKKEPTRGRLLLDPWGTCGRRHAVPGKGAEPATTGRRRHHYGRGARQPAARLGGPDHPQRVCRESDPGHDSIMTPEKRRR
jgi:hypothetical protein